MVSHLIKCLLKFIVITTVFSTPLGGADVIIEISSPIEGATYLYSNSIHVAEIVAVFDVGLSEGPWTDAIRSEPNDFEICMSWSIENVNSSHPVTCRALLSSSLDTVQFPNLNIFRDNFGKHTFTAFVQRKVNSLSAKSCDLAIKYPIPSSNVSYQVDSAWNPVEQMDSTAHDDVSCLMISERSVIDCNVSYVDASEFEDIEDVGSSEENNFKEESIRSLSKDLLQSLQPTMPPGDLHHISFNQSAQRSCFRHVFHFEQSDKLLDLSYDLLDTIDGLVMYVCGARALGPKECRQVEEVMKRSVIGKRLLHSRAHRKYTENRSQFHQEEVCPEAALRRSKLNTWREWLSHHLSSVSNCARPIYEMDGAGSSSSAGGAHWTSRPVGSCAFQNIMIIHGTYYFVTNKSEANDHIKLPNLRLSAHDASAKLSCGTYEIKPKSTQESDSNSEELLRFNVIHYDILASVLTFLNYSLASVNELLSTKQPSRIPVNGGGEFENVSQADAEEGSTTVPKEVEVDVVFPLWRVHVKNHGHLLEDSVAAMHEAMNLVGMTEVVRRRNVLVLLMDHHGKSNYDDRFSLVSKYTPIQLKDLKAIHPESNLLSNGGKVHFIPLLVSGIGSLGMHGCEYGLHPDTFDARLESFLHFRNTVLCNIGISNSSQCFENESSIKEGTNSLNKVNDNNYGGGDDENNDDDGGDVGILRVLLVQRPDQRKFTNIERLLLEIQSINSEMQKLNIKLDVQTVDYSKTSLLRQINVSYHSDILVAVDGTALANALFMKNRSGVVVIGRECSQELPCYWDCACAMLQLEGPSWHEWVVNSSYYEQISKSYSFSTARLENHEFLVGKEDADGGYLKSHLFNQFNELGSSCSPSFANRLCIEMWRPYLESSYIETQPNHKDPFAVNCKLIKEAIMYHAMRIVNERHEKGGGRKV